MALEQVREHFAVKENLFYRRYYRYFIIALMAIIVATMLAVGVVLYQIMSRPLPLFHAAQADGQMMNLTPYEEPNLLPETLMRFAAKAITLAYTFNFVDYEQSINQARPYFTEAGWQGFRAAINPTIEKIVQAQLFVSGVVTGPPVITNEGSFPEKGYAWRIQVPFLVSYTSSETSTQKAYVVIVTIVRVPTSINPQGIGIDQIVMA